MDRSVWWWSRKGARSGAGGWPDQESGIHRSVPLLGGVGGASGDARWMSSAGEGWGWPMKCAEEYGLWVADLAIKS